MKQTLGVIGLATLALAGCAGAGTGAGAAEDGWRPLVDGRTLDGWYVQGPQGGFTVEDGMIVGTTAPNTVGTSFLVTEDQYDDFILEADVKIDPGINSGIQIRSHVHERDTTTTYLSGRLERRERDWPAGKVYGYQVEVDPSERAWTGGFYEEGLRGWLQPLTENPAARAAFRPGEWNTLRIEARGDHFRTWVNGVPAADHRDDRAREGFIGLQLHAVGNPEHVGKKVYWRNLRIRELD